MAVTRGRPERDSAPPTLCACPLPQPGLPWPLGPRNTAACRPVSETHGLTHAGVPTPHPHPARLDTDVPFAALSVRDSVALPASSPAAQSSRQGISGSERLSPEAPEAPGHPAHAAPSRPLMARVAPGPGSKPRRDRVFSVSDSSSTSFPCQWNTPAWHSSFPARNTAGDWGLVRGQGSRPQE